VRNVIVGIRTYIMFKANTQIHILHHFVHPIIRIKCFIIGQLLSFFYFYGFKVKVNAVFIGVQFLIINSDIKCRERGKIPVVLTFACFINFRINKIRIGCRLNASIRFYIMHCCTIFYGNFNFHFVGCQ